MDSIGVYERLGVRRVINAWGVATELGGWGQSERVTQAMEEANRGTVEMQELLRKSGDFIADLLGVEAAFVTSGGAAAQALSVAACMAGTDPDQDRPASRHDRHEERGRDPEAQPVHVRPVLHADRGEPRRRPGTTTGRPRTTWTRPSARTRRRWPTTSSRPSTTLSFRWRTRSRWRGRGA